MILRVVNGKIQLTAKDRSKGEGKEWWCGNHLNTHSLWECAYYERTSQQGLSARSLTANSEMTNIIPSRKCDIHAPPPKSRETAQWKRASLQAQGLGSNPPVHTYVHVCMHTHIEIVQMTVYDFTYIKFKGWKTVGFCCCCSYRFLLLFCFWGRILLYSPR